MKKIILPNIPIFKNPIIAIKIDFKKKKEHLVIGDLENINSFIRYKKNNERVIEVTRPLGSFLFDVIAIDDVEYFPDLMVYLCDKSKKKYDENLHRLEELYNSENPTHKYVALKLWEEYQNFLSCKEKDNTYPIRDKLEALTLPFRIGLINSILNWQKNIPFNPLLGIPSDYLKYPALTLVVPDSKNTSEYIASEFTLLPLIIFYLKTIYENKKYIKYCKVCGKLFFASDNNKNFICSDKCRTNQQKLNKKKYDDTHKDINYEKAYKNETQYWRNRIHKAKKHKLSSYELTRVSQLFSEFRKLALKKKKDVYKEKITSNDLLCWFLVQRDVIDDFMKEHNLDKKR